jgi:acyl-CoA thioester hydrolase
VSSLSPFRTRFVVETEDIDFLGHASNIAYLRWIQNAAVAHSEAMGLGVDAYHRLGAIFVIRRHEVDYLRPLVRGDRVEARTWISTVMGAKVHRMSEFVRESDGTVAARADTTWGYVELATGRPTRIPDEVRRAFGQPERRERSTATASELQ